MARVDDVVDAACAIADAEGLEAVTLAATAAALGVRSPSLYSHVAGLGELQRLIALRGMTLLGDALTQAAVGRAGSDALAAMARAYRQFAHAHPGLYAASLQARADRESAAVAEKGIATIFAVLAVWGLDGEQAIHAVRAYRSMLHGFVSLERAGGFGLPTAVDESFEWLLAALIAALQADVPRAR